MILILKIAMMHTGRWCGGNFRLDLLVLTWSVGSKCRMLCIAVLCFVTVPYLQYK
jgi:hypothetical protein